MRIVVFTHPYFLHSQSMPRFAGQLISAMKQRGHSVEEWTPKDRMYRLSLPGAFKKWLGYIDQYLIFPKEVKQRLKKYPAETLFVFADQALGPWMPMVAHRKHVVHCHDFLAQYSALDAIAENPTGWTGKQYQAYIRNGYRKAKNFISVSEKTRNDLHYFLGYTPSFSKVVYNGLNPLFVPGDVQAARKEFGGHIHIELSNGYLLHVGGNQWYKNRTGIIELYDAWRQISQSQIPLLLIGQPADEALQARHTVSPFKDSIHFLTGIDDTNARLAYVGATLFLFPSYAEGFGWPIAEAMACGCPVLTTNEAPMTEVAGDAGFFVARRSSDESWSRNGAHTIEEIVRFPDEKRKEVTEKGLLNIQRFNVKDAFDHIEAMYKEIF